MRRLRWMLLGLAASVIPASGCTRQWVRGFGDHGTLNLTTMEVQETANYYVWRTSEHIFYMCRDDGAALICKRECGAKGQDLDCPASASAMGTHASNTR